MEPRTASCMKDVHAVHRSTDPHPPLGHVLIMNIIRLGLLPAKTQDVRIGSTVA